ncbi:MAG: M55 family metallopeptidase [Christensenellales bacterium]
MASKKRIYISSDIEGTCGIVHWAETEKGQDLYEHFARQMTREVRAACKGVLSGGAQSVCVKDAHDSARNIDPEKLPEVVTIYRGWARDPLCMVTGIDQGYDGVLFTGYHSAAGTNYNPLAHTMNTQNNFVRINGEKASELMINAMAAAYYGVPTLMVTGDRGLCEWMNEKLPEVLTVPTNTGCGKGAWSIHPNLAVKRIREAAEKAMSLNPEKCLFPIPPSFEVEIEYKEHDRARSASFYPGARLSGAKSVSYETKDYFDVLTFFHFVL